MIFLRLLSTVVLWDMFYYPHVLKKILFISLFSERGEGRERNINWLPLTQPWSLQLKHAPWSGIEQVTFLICERMLNPVSHTSQGYPHFLCWETEFYYMGDIWFNQGLPTGNPVWFCQASAHAVWRTVMNTGITCRAPFPTPGSSNLSPYIPHSFCFSHLASCCCLNTPTPFRAQNLEFFSPDSGTAHSLTSPWSLLKSDLIKEHCPCPWKPWKTVVLISPHLL